MDAGAFISVFLQRQLYFFVLLATLSVTPTVEVEARSNVHCVGQYYSGFSRQCGRNLQAGCDSGPVCDAGFIQWSGTGFPFTINCPNINHTKCTPNPIPFLPPICVTVSENIPNEQITSGCYDETPTCNACGGNGQAPCPVNTGLSCEGCDSGTIFESTTNLCLSPDTIGAICDVSVGCANGLLCDPDSTQCFAEAQAGQSCFPPSLPCADGLQCTLALQCSHSPGLEGETCDVSAPCSSGLFCKPGIPQRCAAQSKPGERCNLLLPNVCVEGSFCSGDGAEAICQIDPFGPDITLAQCKSFYSPTVARPPANGLPTLGDLIPDAADRTRTIGAGTGEAVGNATSSTHGVVYSGPNETFKYGCFNAVCEGFELDVTVDFVFTNGYYGTYDRVGGTSSTLVEEYQIPGSIFNVGSARVFDLDNEQIGHEVATGPGIGINPFPATIGGYTCETELINAYGDFGGDSTPPPLPSPTPPNPPSLSFGALQFDGIDDRITVWDAAQNAQLTVNTELTVELWFRAEAADQSTPLVSKAGEYQIALDQGELVFQIANTAPGFGAVQRSDNLRANELKWMHVALVYADNSSNFEIRLYIDGQLVVNEVATGNIGDADLADNTFTIGGEATGAAAFKGSMDQVRVWSKALTEAEVLASVSGPVNAASDGLLAAWNFDGARGSVTTDSSAQAIDLALDANGGAAQPNRVGTGRELLGGAMHFDGENDYVAMPSEVAMDTLVMTGALTIEAWVFPTGPGLGPAGGVIAGKEGEYYIARNAQGALFFALANTFPGWTARTTAVQLDENQWTHVALTYDPQTELVLVYANGVLAHTESASGAIGDFHSQRDQFRIGGRQNDDITSFEPLAFDGYIDEVRVWNRARLDFEVADAFDQALDVSVESGLVGYWRFDEAQTSIALDSSIYALHGSLGLGKSWRYPQRIDSRAFIDYPTTLLTGACSLAGCAVDADNDGFSDYVDNCQLAINPSQIDADGDGFGNACDPDFDNNGVVNFLDISFFAGTIFSSDVLTDLNTDGAVNFLDFVTVVEHLFFAPGPSAND